MKEVVRKTFGILGGALGLIGLVSLIALMYSGKPIPEWTLGILYFGVGLIIIYSMSSQLNLNKRAIIIMGGCFSAIICMVLLLYRLVQV